MRLDNDIQPEPTDEEIRLIEEAFTVDYYSLSEIGKNLFLQAALIYMMTPDKFCRVQRYYYQYYY